MERRNLNATVTETVTAAMTRTGHTVDSVSKATDIPAADLTHALYGGGSLTVVQLANVGGLFRVSPAELLRSAA